MLQAKEFKINDAIAGFDGFRLSIKTILFVRFVWLKKRGKTHQFYFWYVVENFVNVVFWLAEFPLDIVAKGHWPFSESKELCSSRAKIFSLSVVLARWFDQPSITRELEAFCLTDVLGCWGAQQNKWDGCLFPVRFVCHQTDSDEQIIIIIDKITKHDEDE